MYIVVAYHPITRRRGRAASRHGEPERLAVLAIVLITEGALIAVMGKHAQREIADSAMATISRTKNAAAF
jgi:hypothetical protein